jgi:hypothetical protein
MTLDGWKLVVLHAADDVGRRDLLAKLLYEQDQAKESLRRLGYGVIGTPWPKVIAEVDAHMRQCTGVGDERKSVRNPTPGGYRRTTGD